MSLDLAMVLDGVRDQHPAFHRSRVPHAVLARFFTGYQRQLLSRAQRLNPLVVTAQASLLLQSDAANAPGTVGPGTSGGLPLAAGVAVTLDEDVAGLLGESTGAVRYGPFVATSATALGVHLTGAGWTVNAWANKLIVVAEGPAKGQERSLASNDADDLVLDDPWTLIPGEHDLLEIRDAAVAAAEQLGVVTQLPPTGQRTGYLARIDATGQPYFDLTQPIVARFDAGIPLPAHQRVLDGGSIWLTNGDLATSPFRLVDYAHREHGMRWHPYAGYLAGATLVLLGGATDWTGVASIALRYVPEPPPFTVLTDLFLLPDNAYQALVQGGAAFAAQRVSALLPTDTAKIDLRRFDGLAAQAAADWLNLVGDQLIGTVSYVEEVE